MLCIVAYARWTRAYILSVNTGRIRDTLDRKIGLLSGAGCTPGRVSAHLRTDKVPGLAVLHEVNLAKGTLAKHLDWLILLHVRARHLLRRVVSQVTHEIVSGRGRAWSRLSLFGQTRGSATTARRLELTVFCDAGTTLREPRGGRVLSDVRRRNQQQKDLIPVRHETNNVDVPSACFGNLPRGGCQNRRSQNTDLIVQQSCSQSRSRTVRIACLFPHRSSVSLPTVPPFRRHLPAVVDFVEGREEKGEPDQRFNVSAYRHANRYQINRPLVMHPLWSAGPPQQACSFASIGTTLVDRSTSSSNG